MFNPLWKQTRFHWHVWLGPHRGVARKLVPKLKTAVNVSRSPELTDRDRLLVHSIREETERWNRNNITRTKAYLKFYLQHPEIHWALLAHAVSRNGGWGMTDLRGEWFLRIAQKDHPHKFFAFLERANWLIFGDAYPQLLLYEAGKQDGTNYHYLLPCFGISKFMTVMWEWFRETQDEAWITKALIVNEQNFIEQRVVQNTEYSESVLATAQYQVQSLLDLTHVVFPFQNGSDVRLAGTIVNHFVSLEDRISTGKRLYRILFGDKRQNRAIQDWMERVEHSGSRADYWPELFTPDSRAMHLKGKYRPRLTPGAGLREKVYSPRLSDVWPDVQHRRVERGDWFRHVWQAADLFDEVQKPAHDFTDEYVQGLRTTESILVAKQKAEQWVTD